MAKNWIIKEPPNINKILRRLGSIERKRYDFLLDDFENCEDPTKLGVIEKFKGVKLYVSRLNDSYRVKYIVNRKERFVIILSIGDHKEVGLKE